MSEKSGASPHGLGRAGEEAALAYLKKKKFRILEHGFRFLGGEIDVIAWDRKTLVFLEVKTRKTLSCGEPEESVTPHKQNQIRKTAEGYLMMRHLENVACRFDILSLSSNEKGDFNISHFENAF